MQLFFFSMHAFKHSYKHAASRSRALTSRMHACVCVKSSSRYYSYIAQSINTTAECVMGWKMVCARELSSRPSDRIYYARQTGSSPTDGRVIWAIVCKKMSRFLD